MGRLSRFLLLAGISCILLTGCRQDVPVAEAPLPSTESEITVTESLLPVPATSVTETAAPEETTPPETTAATQETLSPEQIAEGQPVLALPEAIEGDIPFFDDAAFMGDSISYSLMVHHTRSGDLGNAIFLVRGSLGIHNTLNKQLAINYQGRSLTPWDALKTTGVKKVFIMMGTNDIGYYGIDATMEKWEVFLGKIRETCPELQIYIQSLTPMWNGAQQQLLNNENIDLYNQRLEAFALENGCHFVNIAPYFKDNQNGLAAPYSGDLYVHMNEVGTAAWARVLRAYGAQQEKEMS